jgi:hypothetical protein
MPRPIILVGVIALCLISASFVLGDEPEHLTIDGDSGTFESFGTVTSSSGSDGSPDEDDATLIGDGLKLTEFACVGDECRKMTKADLEKRKSNQANKRASNQIQFDAVRRILQTNDENNLYAELFREGVPTVIQNSVLLRQWSAFSDWNFEYFANLWTVHKGVGPILVSQSTKAGFEDTIFLYNNASKDSQWPNVPKPYYETAMNLGSFLSGQCTKESKETWWWQKPFVTLQDDQVEADTSPLDFFIDHSAINKTTPQLSLVMGSRGSKMQLHYDLDDNFLVQVHRRQQVFLFSPSQMRQLYLYPWIHPHRRRSQVTPLVHATDAQFPKISQIRGLEAMLDAGDVLYIPRNWGYHIDNYDPGIAVQVTTPIVSDRVSSFKKHLVSLSHLDTMKRLTAGKLAIKRILEPLLSEIESGQTSPKEYEILDDVIQLPPEPVYDRATLRKFLKEHLAQRYAKLPSYLRPGVDMTQKEINQLVKISCREARLPEHQLQAADVINFSMSLDRSAEEWRELDPDVRLLTLADWVDFIAWQATADHRHASAFLSKCF